MATPTFQQISRGDARPQQGQNSNKTNNRRGSAANTAGAQRVTTSGAEGEADEPDSSANDGTNHDDDDANAFALSNVQMLDKTQSGQRLAGPPSPEMFGDDMIQTTPGASIADDDMYAGVESVSDDENELDGSRDIMRAAEQDLIAEFELEESEAVFDFSVNLNDDPFQGHMYKSDTYLAMAASADEAAEGWPMEITRENSEGSTETKKRVRFEEPVEMLSRSSSMSSSEEQDPNELFPDLFDAQDDPALRRQYGVDYDLGLDFSDAGSCYDFDGEEERLALAIDDEDSDSDEDFDDDTEEEEFDDDTDEETEEETIARVQAMQKRAAEMRKATPSTPTPTRRPASVPRVQSSPVTPKGGSKAPRMGTFLVPTHRAILSSNHETKKVEVQPPIKPLAHERAFWERAKSAANSRSSTPRSSTSRGHGARNSVDADMSSRPFTAKSTLNNMFGGNLEFMRNNADADLIGDLFPAFVPRTRTSFTSETLGDDSDDPPLDLNMQDFVDIEESDSDDNGEPASASSVLSPTQSELCDSFASLDAPRSDSLLDHLEQNRGLVGSFRRNQNFAKHVSSLPSHPTQRASASEHNALQKGRRGAANTPLTPARKKRISQDLGLTGAGVRKTVSSPLAGRRPRSRGSSLSGINQTLGPDIMK